MKRPSAAGAQQKRTAQIGCNTAVATKQLSGPVKKERIK
jgi:hypothetical protein